MTSFKPSLAGLLCVLVLGSCVAARNPESPPAPAMSIAEAREKADEEPVDVTGIVTVQSGAFASSLSPGFAIQDGTAGIYVLDTQHTFELGNRVRVTGRRGEENEQRNIVLDSAERLPGSGTIATRSVRTGHIGEADAGSLIQAAGRIVRVEDDAPYGYKIFIDDGSGELQVFIDASTELIDDLTIWKHGDRVQVTGFAGRYQKTYEIMPRIISDMRKTEAN